jgi:S-formylglutathione hydrolase FrmB
MMKRFFAVFAVALFAFAGTVRASSLERVEHKSEILKTTKNYTVYLPDGYKENPDKAYPVLYLLHGAGTPGDQAWQRNGKFQGIADFEIRSGFALEMIIVCPDATSPFPNEEGGKYQGYFNRPDWAYEDYFFQELIPDVEKNFRVKADRGSRAISGLSMGGGGTTVYALRHPEMFSSACPMSAFVGTAKYLGGMLGDLGKTGSENAVTDIMDGLSDEQMKLVKEVRWYVDCGDDDFLYDGNIQLVDKMRQKGIPRQFRVRDGGHTWEYWMESLHEVLKFVSIGFAQ